MNSTEGQEGHRKRLRKRFLSSGFSGFVDHEIVELFLTLCVPRKDVKPQAKELLEKFGSIQEIFDADVNELSKVRGMGSVAPIALKMIKSFSEIYLRKKLESDSTVIDNYARLEQFWRLRLGGIGTEVFEVALLNTRLKVLKDGVVRLEEGVVDRIDIYPRKIMEYALRRHASAIIIAHNHPSGSVVPSDNDRLLTKKIERAAESLDIRLIDHVIVAHQEIFSFRRENLIAKQTAK
jgi:DNA repair protein RadC